MTLLDKALEGVDRLVFDTATFIYFIEEDPQYINTLENIFSRVARGSVTGVTSAITLTEVLVHPLAACDSHLVNEYREILLNSFNMITLAVDAEIAQQAAVLRARYNIRTPDSIQIAATLSAGCTAFLTNDDALRRISDINIILLKELSL